MKTLALSALLLSACATTHAGVVIPANKAATLSASTVKVKCDGGHGSGVVVNKTPLRSIIVTAAHVVDGCDGMSVNGVKATSWKIHDELDVAILSVPGDHGVVAQVRRPFFGEQVRVVGFPADRYTRTSPITITSGEVAALWPDEEVFRVTAALSPGVSGGGIWGADGKLIGIATHGYNHGIGWNFYGFFAVAYLDLI